jgi:asparaginyl-tRNA synthetase
VLSILRTRQTKLKKRLLLSSNICNRNFVESKGAGQKFEIQVAKLETGDSDAEKSRYNQKQTELRFLA